MDIRKGLTCLAISAISACGGESDSSASNAPLLPSPSPALDGNSPVGIWVATVKGEGTDKLINGDKEVGFDPRYDDELSRNINFTKSDKYYFSITPIDGGYSFNCGEEILLNQLGSTYSGSYNYSSDYSQNQTEKDTFEFTLDGEGEASGKMTSLYRVENSEGYFLEMYSESELNAVKVSDTPNFSDLYVYSLYVSEGTSSESDTPLNCLYTGSYSGSGSENGISGSVSGERLYIKPSSNGYLSLHRENQNGFEGKDFISVSGNIPNISDFGAYVDCKVLDCSSLLSITDASNTLKMETSIPENGELSEGFDMDIDIQIYK